MTDKQINIVEILAEQCKNCTLYEGDTISLTISIFDRPLRGVCFDNNIYFSLDELNYIMQKLISKEQECEELKKGCSELTDIVSPYMDDFTGYNEELGGFDIVLCVKELMEQLKAENEELKKKCNIYTCGICGNKEDCNKLYKTLTEIRDIAEKTINSSDCYERMYGGMCARPILQKINECEVK